MQDDCIAVALGLPQLKVVNQVELMDRFEVTMIYRHEQVTCPRCGREIEISLIGTHKPTR